MKDLLQIIEINKSGELSSGMRFKLNVLKLLKEKNGNYFNLLQEIAKLDEYEIEELMELI